MRKIYIVGGQIHYSHWMQGELVNSIEEADLVVFTGGEDISPFIYHKNKHKQTFTNVGRDIYELEIYNIAKKLNKKFLGICRGAQLLCALAGGKLIQDQQNPTYLHDIHTYDGNCLAITSTHHQAAYPFDMPEENYKILAWNASEVAYRFGESYQDVMHPAKDCEIVFYPKINALGIQGHPEAEIFKYIHQETVVWCQELLNKFLTNEL